MDMRTALADPQPEPLVRRVALQMAELRKADPLQSKFHPARLARRTGMVELRRALADPQPEALVRQVALHMDMAELGRAGPLQSKFRPAQLAWRTGMVELRKGSLADAQAGDSSAA